MLLRLLTLCALTLFPAFAHAQQKQLKVLIWSDYLDPALIAKFEKDHNTKITLDVYEETEAMLAKLAALKGETKGNTYDIVIASDHAVPVLNKLALIQPLDLTKIPNTKNISPQFQNPPYDPQQKTALPYQWGTVGILYNKQKLPTPPSLKTLLSGNAPAKFILLDSPRDTLGLALKLNNQSVNSKDPTALKAAGKLIAQAKADKNFIAFDGSVSAAKRVITGQADIALTYNGDALTALKEKPQGPDQFDYLVAPEGGIIWVDTMVIPSNANNPGGGHTFINFILDPAHGATLSNYINYATPNAAALPAITPESKADPRIYPTPETLKSMEYLEDVGGATRLYDEVWTAIKAR